MQAEIDAIDTTAEGFDQAAYDALVAERDAAAGYEAEVGALQTAATDAADAAAAAAEAEAAALSSAADGRTLSDDAVAYIRAELGL